MTATIPAVVENHLDVIQHFPDGKTILGSSNLTGRYWGGSLWCFNNADDAPNIEKCLAGVETEAGISDAAILGKDKIIIGLDSGSVELISLKSDPIILSNEFYSCEHDHLISSISVSSNDMFCISSSFDGCIKVWDVETWACIATYRPAHGNRISRVSCSNVESRVFISCGQDDRIYMWDLRLPKPATLVGKDPLKAIPTCVAWKLESPTLFAAGDEMGQVILKDIRKSVDGILSETLHQRPIFRLVFSPKFPNLLASCADEEFVVVSDVSKEHLEIIYKDDTHSDFVRGLSWHPENNRLYSCSWGKEVLGHDFPFDDKDLGRQDDAS